MVKGDTYYVTRVYCVGDTDWKEIEEKVNNFCDDRAREIVDIKIQVRSPGNDYQPKYYAMVIYKERRTEL